MIFTAIVGIVAEFNPFHNGHKYLIDTARAGGADAVVCCMSGNFVQRGDTAVISKFARAKTALLGGIDLCLELPVPYSLSSAPGFALGGVASLLVAGVDRIIFGSECGNIEKLIKIAECLQSPAFSDLLSDKLSAGISFPAARQRAAAEIIGKEYAAVLESPNDNLGIEYIIAAGKLGANIDYVPVKRVGTDHDATAVSGKYASASLLREFINNKFDQVAEFIPDFSFNILKEQLDNGRISDIRRLDKAIISVLRIKPYDEYSELPDVSEGIENRLFRAVRTVANVEELYKEIKVKRYPLARIRRLVLSAFIGIDKSFSAVAPPYVRVLGYSAAGGELLKKGFKYIPSLCRFSDVAALGKNAEKLYETECRATDLFELSLIKPGPCGSDKTFKIIKG